MKMFENKKLNLGIDAGGTFTDLVLFDSDEKTVLKTTKIPTCHENMLKTLEQGLTEILKDVESSAVEMVNFATTFATNAIVENKMRPVHLALIGYNLEDVKTAQAAKRFTFEDYTIITGGHKANGDEIAALDEKALIEMIENLPKHIEGIALSGFFSIRNPSHELKATEIIKNLRPDLPISAGHQLTWELDAYKRGTTAVLNAGLIPIIIELIEALETILEGQGVNAPMTVVRGDGTSVGSSWAKLHPVEMLLSGPAASAVGAGFIGKTCDDTNSKKWICDIGGTTTDIVCLENGKPKISKTGATVGDHKTLVKSIDIYTFGQGGDSHVSMEKNGTININPMRIKPLCVAATEYPNVIETLRHMAEIGIFTEPIFILPNTKGKLPDDYLNRLMAYIGDKAVSVYELSKSKDFNYVNVKYVLKMAHLGYIDIASFTPTDAFHVLGTFERWNKEAAALGLKILTYNKDTDLMELAQKVQNKMVNNIATAIFKKSIETEFTKGVTSDISNLIAKTLDLDDNLYEMIKFHLNGLLIGAGAPSALVVSDVAKSLNTKPVIAENAEVAGAVGAAVGTFSFSGSVRISHPHKGIFRVHHRLGIDDYEDLDLAVEKAKLVMEPWLVERAKAAAVQNPKIQMERMDVTVTGNIYLWTELLFSVTQPD